MTETNPYQAPQADVVHASVSANAQLSGPRAVSAGQGWAWLAEGFRYFGRNPFAWIIAFVVWLVIGILVGLIPLLGNLAMNIFGPVISAGFMLGVHAQANDQDFEIGHAFAGFSNENLGQLIVVGLLYLVGAILIVIVCAVMFVGMFAAGGGLQAILAGDYGQVLQNMDNIAAIALPVLVALLLFIPLVMCYWFASPLVVFHKLSAIDAMKLSFRGCLLNVVPFLVYGVITLVLSIIAVIPIGLGLLVLFPVLVASIYAGYRDIYIG